MGTHVELEALVRALLLASGQETWPAGVAGMRPPPTLALAVVVVQTYLVTLRRYWADFEWVARVETLIGHLELLAADAADDAGGWLALSDVITDLALAEVPADAAPDERIGLLATAARRWPGRREQGLADASDMAAGVDRCDEALLLCPGEDPRRPSLLFLKGMLLYSSAWSQQMTSLPRLDEAIRAFEEALAGQRGDGRLRRFVLLFLARAHAMRDGESDATVARGWYKAALDGIERFDESTCDDVGVPAALELTELELAQAENTPGLPLEAASQRLQRMLQRGDMLTASDLLQARRLEALLEVALADQDRAKGTVDEHARSRYERRVRAALGLLDEARVRAAQACLPAETQLELLQLQAYWLLEKLRDLPAAHAAYLECAQRLDGQLRGERRLDRLVEWKNQFHGVYRGLAQTQIEQNRPDDAFDTAATARARFANALLADWLTSRPPAVDAADWQRFRDALGAYWQALPLSRDEAEAERLSVSPSAATALGRDRGDRARHDYVTALSRIARAAPVAARIVSGAGTTAEEAARCLTTDQALVVLYPLLDRTVAFVVRRRSATDYRVHAVPVGPGYRDEAVHASPLVRWLIPYEEIRRRGLSVDRLAELRVAFDDQLRAFARAFDLAALLEPLSGARAVWLVLHYPFDFVPVHAVPLPDGTCLLDRFDVSFLPSADFLRPAGQSQGPQRELGRRASTLWTRRDPAEWRYFGVSDPRPNPPHHLSYSACEVGAVASLFLPDRRELAPGARATAAAVLAGIRTADVVHLSCHGQHGYVFRSSIRSQLLLGNGEVLALADAFNRSAAHAPQLVVLSACDSGAADPRAFGDEVANFPTGFLQARARAVVSTSWQVEERATALLLFDFFQRLHGGQHSVPEALRAAQRWIRSATGHQLAELADEMLERVPDEARAPGLRLWAQRHRCSDRAETIPYEDPFYWAAFRAWGA